MAQISLYMDDTAMAALRADAEQRGTSISSYAREMLERRHETERNGWTNGWPPGYFDLFGSIPDFPASTDAPPEPIEAW
ncbi:ribbon-helix-helix domain-containing protein [Adlercreutzia murintestinalis]|uniref:ribbon-helix-helix domain-containing protein n=1 Tax=Adlercreutzia murintestinalis TaxID=2941325 RepID=UPI00203C4382|nr:ribbon-helix-helix domain-containing protein [Adlercreutzia murintestinalis]